MHLRNLFTAACALTLGAAIAAIPASPASAGGNPWTCPAGGNKNNTWDPRGYQTLDDEAVWQRNIELRYHTGTRCAWGKISNGSPGDSVWVDWSANGGSSWRQLSVTRIASGYRQVYTLAHNHEALMRACGKAGNRPEVRCTDWK